MTVSCSIADNAQVNGALPVQNGQMRLEHIGETADLTGYWAFWPSRFIHPSVHPENYARFELFPSSWTLYQDDSGKARGYASYAMTISGLDPRFRYAFRFPGFSSAARFFVNGQLLYQQGVPATNRKDEVMNWESVVVPLPEPGLNELRLVLHISNFTDALPGGQMPIRFGVYHAVSEDWTRDRLMLILPFAAILALGSYFLALSILHRNDQPSLWLGLLSMVFALRITCYEEFFVRDLVPFISMGVLFRLGYLTISVGIACFAGFINAMFPKYSRWYIIRFILAGSALFTAINVLLPVIVISYLYIGLEIFLILCGLYFFWVILHASIAGAETAGIFLAGFTFFFAFVINDVLVATRLVQGRFLVHHGILAIVGSMVLIIVTNFSRAFNYVEQVSANLTRLNESLTRFIPRETFRNLGKSNLMEIKLGDNVLKEQCVMFISIGNDIQLVDTASRLAVFKMIGDTINKIHPVIKKYDGYVDKYLAEGVLVLLPDEPIGAVACALEVSALIRTMNIERSTVNLPQVRFSCGIHRGAMIMGTIGEPERMDNTVISDAVNIASRLNQFAYSSGKSIIVSGSIATVVQLHSLCSLLLQGNIKLRGKDQEIPVFEVRPT